MSIFKKKKKKTENPFGEKNAAWWDRCLKLFKKDFPDGVIDPNDPAGI